MLAGIFFLTTVASFCLFSQIAMRGPPGPMGLTGRPGPVVCKQNWYTFKSTETQAHRSHSGLAYTSVFVLILLDKKPMYLKP